jgi:ribonuclease HI
MVTAPHFLLYTQAHHDPQGGRWRFTLKRGTGRVVLEAADTEAGLVGPRLDLLAVVRGLEALEFPSRVTLLTDSRYVRRGIEQGLPAWRQNNWTWEWFGHMVPVRNRDLWQRVDLALRFHQVQCRRWRIDGSHAKGPQIGERRLPRQSAIVLPDEKKVAEVRQQRATGVARACRRRALLTRRWMGEQWDALRLRLGQLGTGLVGQPWFD